MDNELMVKSIRDLCKKNNISISKLQDDLGFGTGLISRWSKNSPSIDKIIDIANYFHVSLDEVVGRKYYTKDEFILSIIALTQKKNLIWKQCLKNNEFVKEYIIPKEDINEILKTLGRSNITPCSQKTYYANFKSGYLCIHVVFIKNNILDPINLTLFLQLQKDSELVRQDYESNELKSLWNEIISSLDKNNSASKVDNFKKELIEKQKISDLRKTTRFEHSLGATRVASSFMEDLSPFVIIQDKTNSMFKSNNENLFTLIEELNNPDIERTINLMQRLIEYNKKIKDKHKNEES